MKFHAGKILIMLVPVTFILAFSCTKRVMPVPQAVDSLFTNPSGTGPEIMLTLVRGKYHNHPTLAVWLENENGEYIQTLFVTRSIARGVFNYVSTEGGKWKPGEIRRPAALPYWGHKRGIRAGDGLYIPTPEDPIPDACSGATPKAGFVLRARADKPLPGRFRILVEINQTWDWNEYWTNNKFPGNSEYMTSSQPAVVYAAMIDTEHPLTEYTLSPIGHSHYAGENGNLFPDLHTLTTALQIADDIRVRINMHNQEH